MPRPRGEVPAEQLRELRRARTASDRAQARLREAVVAAIEAGGSYTAVAEAAGLAKSTVQLWAKD
ncbi:MAG: hypothetical protein EPO65_00420 [Dehalococcoidia bacterium]|nr:MAG: hypothetical protein EPO65_00420 [Dehalococcoidia bacterium]